MRRAFFHSGSLKANTPSDIASTPVNAVQPAEKALKMKNKLSPSLRAVGDNFEEFAQKLVDISRYQLKQKY